MDIETYKSLTLSFAVINNTIFFSFNIVIDNILILDFNKAYQALYAIFNSFILADKLLKNINKNNLNKKLLDNFNNIVEGNNTAYYVYCCLKHIRNDDGYLIDSGNIQTLYIYILNNNILIREHHKLYHTELIKNIKDFMLKTLINQLYPDTNLTNNLKKEYQTMINNHNIDKQIIKNIKNSMLKNYVKKNMLN